MTEYTQTRIARLCDDALRRSGALGVVPTPLEAVQEALGVSRRVLPVGDGILGAMWFDERVLFVDTRQTLGRRRFTEAHELAHLLCPWHRAVIRLDTGAQLFGSLGHGLEAEANLGAAELIFQAEAFAAAARGRDVSLATAFDLGERFAASRQAAAHHYVQRSHEPVALAIAGRWPGRDGRLPVWRTVESPGFQRRFGRLEVPRLDGAVEAARCASEPVTARAGRLHVEVFNNRHCHLILVRP
jgi:IrrE N-terminal-like domain